MEKYIKKHLKWMEKENWTEEDFNYFLEVIKFVQHERFIHLIITILTAILFLLFGLLFLIAQNIVTTILFLILTIVLIFYIRYYCFIENSVQKMYFMYTKKKSLV